MSRALRLGSRRSALARVQAWQVGAALQRLDPSLRIEYRFIEASGDRSADPDAGRVTARGGFTEDLGLLLDAGELDLAVHSFKDLPLGARAGTAIAATLPRADPRDVLLLRREALDAATQRGLTVLSSSARRRAHLEEFLGWALPLRPASLRFAPVRGDIETRLRKLLRGDGDALVIAKAALDRLLDIVPDTLAATGADSIDKLRVAQRVVREALDACRAMVLPLHDCPAAPAQAALAVEVPTRTASATLWRALNHADSFDLATTERAIALELGEDSPLGITRLRFEFGDVEFRRGAQDTPQQPRLRLHRIGTGLPRPRGAQDIWSGEDSDAGTRIAMSAFQESLSFGDTSGLLVSRDEALPQGAQVGARTVIWTPGLATWRKLARRGYWVTGSDESLGETGGAPVRSWYPDVDRWLKLTHDRGYARADAEWMPTYRVERHTPPRDLGQYTHFFWRSGTELREYLARFPRLAEAWHGCGPGNTWRQARDLLGAARLRPYLDAAQFRAELLA